MRLPAASNDPLPNPVAGRSTLDEVLAHNAARHPDGQALVDGALPFAGSWREVDRAVSALAARFAAWRLSPDAAVGVQMGSSPEGALVIAALWRAGLIPAVLPLPWRRREVAAALDAVRAEAIVAVTERSGMRPAETACEAAVNLERVRFIGSFGANPPDGATPLDAALVEPAPLFERTGRPDDAADHVAVIGFELGAVPVARTHNELVAASLGALLASQLGASGRLMSTLDLGGLAGLATGLAPWLLARCAVTFHQASSTAAFAAAARALEATHVAAPGRALERLVGDGALGGILPDALIAVWRAPDPRSGASASGLTTPATLVDVTLFGELGLVAAARKAPTRPVATPLGPVAPEGLAPLIETQVTPDGRVLVRGPACPGGRFLAAGGARLTHDADGFVDTGLVGIADRASGRISLGGRRRGVAQVGGVALSLSEAEATMAAVGLAGSVSVEDDAALGGRLRLEPAGGRRVTEAEAAEALAEAGFGAGFAPLTAPLERARLTA